MKDLLAQLDRVCRARNWTVALAESCTGGLLSSQITAQAGVSSWFRGAVVSYHRQVKTDILHVPHSLILAHGEVSLPVARAMAQGARRALSANWSVSITGIAGPGGGSAAKPIGMVCFSVAGPGVDHVEEQRFSPLASRHEIQMHAAHRALVLLLAKMG